MVERPEVTLRRETLELYAMPYGVLNWGDIAGA